METIIRAATPSDRLQLERFPSAVAFLSDSVLVAVCDGSVVAFLAWRALMPGESEILRLETAAGFQKRGLASGLIQKLKEQVPGSLFLEVRQSNHAARELYAKQGFTHLCVRARYYSSPPEDGIVLQFHPC